MSAPAYRSAVLLVASEDAIGLPFASALGRAGIRYEHVDTADAARETRQRIHPSVAIVDVDADAGAAELCEEWHGESGPYVLALLDRATADNGKGPPADGIVVKPFGTEQVAARVHKLVGSLRVTTEPRRVAVRLGDLEIDFDARTARLAGELLDLRPKEMDLLLRLARDAEKVVPRDELMADVWGEGREASSQTLDVHIRRLRAKLGESPSDSRLLHTIRGVGFRLGEERVSGSRRSGPVARSASS